MTQAEILALQTKWATAMVADPNTFPMSDVHREIIKEYLAILPSLSMNEVEKPWYVIFQKRGERSDSRLRRIKTTEALLKAWQHR